jgi:cobalamin synthase
VVGRDAVDGVVAQRQPEPRLRAVKDPQNGPGSLAWIAWLMPSIELMG